MKFLGIMKTTKQDNATLRKISDFLSYFDKAMAELALVSDMIISHSQTLSSDAGLPEVEFNPQDGISVCVPGNMIGFIKTPERYLWVVSYCAIRSYVLGALWHDEEQLDVACESFLRQLAERNQPHGIIGRLWHRLIHRRNLALRYLQMFRNGRQIYKEYQSLL